MVENTQSRKPDFLGVEFDAFLFAPIGADTNGSSVTVVSALARLDLDPWAEAAKLTRLPGAVATQKLAELILRLPEIPSVRVNSSMIAARLTALLPGRILSNIATPQILIRRLPPAGQSEISTSFIILLVFITFTAIFGMQIAVKQFHPTKTPSITETAASTAPVSKILVPTGADAEKTGN